MSGKTVPQKVTVIVYGAKGLKPKHKGKHKFSVVFGVGSCKFRTDVVEDLFDNPVFNTESEIDVEDPNLTLTLVVSEKHEKDVLGQVVVQLGDLSTHRTNRPTQVYLQPHKKCPKPDGELSFEAWISATTAATFLSSPAVSMVSEAESEGKKNIFPVGFKKLREKISLSPMLSRKSSFGKEHKRSSSDTQRIKGSLSCTDLSAYHPGPPGLKLAPSGALDSGSSMESLSQSHHETEAIDTIKPEVTGVSPKEGPVEGGTKVTVRGANLGRNKEDVIGLFICGSNVLGTLEYFSSSKLVCTTKAWRACVGNVTVETQSGGKGMSLVQFSFNAPPTDSVDSSTLHDSLALSSSSPSASSHPTTSSLVKNSLRARSMFDLPSSAAAGPLKAFPPGPEVTGVSPLEGPADDKTRIIIRGLNLGQSKADVLHVWVCGTDCVDTVEYESPSKLICMAGPWNAGKGDVIVETKSGGKGTSLVQFSFLGKGRGEQSEEGSSWAAVPYSDQGGDNSGSTLGDSSYDKNRPVVRIDRPTNGKVPPPVGEIQPIRVDGKKSSTSPHHRGLFGKRRDKSVSDSPEKTLDGITEEGPLSNKQNRLSYGDGEESKNMKNDISQEQLVELQRQLLAVEDKSSKLQQDNKALREENERMRRYMEGIVSRAIVKCPDILCVDTK